MIRFDHVTHRFGRKTAVDGLDLSIAAGELFALLGRNGAGKTTTIKLLVGLLRPTAGRILVDGKVVEEDPCETNRLVGYVPDQPQLYEKLTGREFLQFIGEMYGLSGVPLGEAIDGQIAQFRLADFVDQLTESYSYGMKQRTVFAAAMLHAPQSLMVLTGRSQLRMSPSQSRKSGAQPVTRHCPVAHDSVALAMAHAVLHPPQSVSVFSGRSQPSR